MVILSTNSVLIFTCGECHRQNKWALEACDPYIYVVPCTQYVELTCLYCNEVTRLDMGDTENDDILRRFYEVHMSFSGYSELTHHDTCTGDCDFPLNTSNGWDNNGNKVAAGSLFHFTGLRPPIVRAE